MKLVTGRWFIQLTVFGGISYITTRGMSFNEGGKCFNVHLNWGGKFTRGYYIYLFGKRFFKFWQRSNNNV